MMTSWAKEILVVHIHYRCSPTFGRVARNRKRHETSLFQLCLIFRTMHMNHVLVPKAGIHQLSGGKDLQRGLWHTEVWMDWTSNVMPSKMGEFKLILQLGGRIGSHPGTVFKNSYGREFVLHLHRVVHGEQLLCICLNQALFLGRIKSVFCLTSWLGRITTVLIHFEALYL